MNIEIPNIFFTSFNDITFHDEPHKYYVGNDELISVTTLIHRYQEEFNEDYWSKYKAEEFSVTQKEILRVWDFINKKGTIKGSAIHDYAENLFQNKIFEYPEQLILNEFGFDPVLPEYLITKKHVDRFYDDVKNSYFEYENYDKEFLDKIFFAFRFECQSILNRKNSFKSGSLTHEYTINNRKKKEFLGKSDKYLNDLKVFNIVQKKLQKIKNA